MCNNTLVIVVREIEIERGIGGEGVGEGDVSEHEQRQRASNHWYGSLRAFNP